MIILDLPVHAIAHARAGDKGDVSNISLIAYLDSGWKVINDLATEERVLDIFRHFQIPMLQFSLMHQVPIGRLKIWIYHLLQISILNWISM